MFLWFYSQFIWRTVFIWRLIKRLSRIVRDGLVLLMIFVFCLLYQRTLLVVFWCTLFVGGSILLLFYLLLVFGLWPLKTFQRRQLLFQTHLLLMLNLPQVVSFSFLLLQVLLTQEASCQSEFVTESTYWKQEAQKAILQSEHTLSTLIESLKQHHQRLSLLQQIFQQHCGPHRHFNHPWKGPGSSLVWSFYGLLAHAFCLELIPNDFSAQTAAMFPWTHRGLPREVHYWSMYSSHWAGLFYQGANFLYSFVDLQRVLLISYGPDSTKALFSESPVFSSLDDTFVEAQQKLSQNISFLKTLQGQVDLLKCPKDMPSDFDGNYWRRCCQKAYLIEGQALATTYQASSEVASKSWYLAGSLRWVSRTYGRLALCGFLEAATLSSTATAIYLYSPEYFPGNIFAVSYWQQGFWELFQGFHWTLLSRRYDQSSTAMEAFALDFFQWRGQNLSEQQIVRCCFQVTYPGFSEDFLMWSLLDQWHKSVEDLQFGFLIWGLQGPEPGEFAVAINFPLSKVPLGEVTKML